MNITWIICPVCKGNEKVDSQGVVNRDDFDDEEWELYLAGDYDVPCAHCKGTGKVPESQAAPITRTGSSGQTIVYEDEDDASEHFLRMAEGRC